MSKSHNGTDISLGGAMANIMQSDLRHKRIINLGEEGNNLHVNFSADTPPQQQKANHHFELRICSNCGQYSQAADCICTKTIGGNSSSIISLNKVNKKLIQIPDLLPLYAKVEPKGIRQRLISLLKIHFLVLIAMLGVLLGVLISNRLGEISPLVPTSLASIIFIIVGRYINVKLSPGKNLKKITYSFAITLIGLVAFVSPAYAQWDTPPTSPCLSIPCDLPMSPTVNLPTTNRIQTWNINDLATMSISSWSRTLSATKPEAHILTTVFSPPKITHSFLNSTQNYSWLNNPSFKYNRLDNNNTYLSNQININPLQLNTRLTNINNFQQNQLQIQRFNSTINALRSNQPVYNFYNPSWNSSTWTTINLMRGTNPGLQSTANFYSRLPALTYP